MSHASLLLATLALAGCTSIGGLSARPTDVDLGGPAELRVCLLRDPAVSEARVAELMTAWRAELAPLGITVSVPWTRVWPRPAFTGRGLGEAIVREPLEPGCDRLLAFIGRHAGDAAYAVAGLFLSAPEIFGWVDNVTMTRGFVVATWSPSLGQALSGGPAARPHSRGLSLARLSARAVGRVLRDDRATEAPRALRLLPVPGRQRMDAGFPRGRQRCAGRGAVGVVSLATAVANACLFSRSIGFCGRIRGQLRPQSDRSGGMTSMVDFAYAMAQTPNGGGSGAVMTQVLFFAAIFAIFYFLLIRPQQRQRREREATLRAVKKGDRVVTTGGMHGTVVGLERQHDDAEGGGPDEDGLRSAALGRIVPAQGEKESGA